MEYRLLIDDYLDANPLYKLCDQYEFEVVSRKWDAVETFIVVEEYGIYSIDDLVEAIEREFMVRVTMK
jgi:hypothetical protein